MIEAKKEYLVIIPEVPYLYNFCVNDADACSQTSVGEVGTRREPTPVLLSERYQS